jgi:hypothetical protein
MAFVEQCCLMVSLVMLVAKALSVLMGVAGRGCPISLSGVHSEVTSLPAL